MNAEPNEPLSTVEPEGDPVVEAIDALGETLEQSAHDEYELSEQLRQMKAERLAGHTWHEVLQKEQGPGALAHFGAVMRTLNAAGAIFRRSLALALVHEGASLSAVAERFGVSRQRIFAIVRNHRSASDED